VISGWLAMRSNRFRWGAAAAFVLLAVVLPPLLGLVEILNPDFSGSFDIFLGTTVLVLALWAVSFNLMLGYTGIISFAHAAYYGVEAYTVALLFERYNVPLLIGVLLSPLVTGVFGLVTASARTWRIGA